MKSLKLYLFLALIIPTLPEYQSKFASMTYSPPPPTNPVMKYVFYQNYPNPFNPSTRIKFSIPQTDSHLPGGARGQLVTLKVYDVLGNEVATLVNEELAAGKYEVEFDAIDLSSGIYFYIIKAGSFVQTKKMVLIK